jgi:hypothetical protein
MVILWLALAIVSVVTLPFLVLLFLPLAFYAGGSTHRVCVKCGTKVAGFFGEVKKPRGKTTQAMRPSER